MQIDDASSGVLLHGLTLHVEGNDGEVTEKLKRHKIVRHRN